MEKNWCGAVHPARAQQLDNWFTYHKLEKGDAERYQLIRDAGRALAAVIMDNTPISTDQNVAIRKVREAVMTANASIACKGQ